MADEEDFVRSNGLSHAAAILLLAALNAGTVRAWPHKKFGERAQVRFMATSICYRTTWGMDEDIYLAALVFSKSGKQRLARLIDKYPNWSPPLARAVLTAVSGDVLWVQRDNECDLPYGEMMLRSAPDDPMALLPGPLHYRPPLDQLPPPETMLPCYRLVRR